MGSRTIKCAIICGTLFVLHNFFFQLKGDNANVTETDYSYSKELAHSKLHIEEHPIKAKSVKHSRIVKNCNDARVRILIGNSHKVLSNYVAKSSSSDIKPSYSSKEEWPLNRVSRIVCTKSDQLKDNINNHTATNCVNSNLSIVVLNDTPVQIFHYSRVDITNTH